MSFLRKQHYVDMSFTNKEKIIHNYMSFEKRKSKTTFVYIHKIVFIVSRSRKKTFMKRTLCAFSRKHIVFRIISQIKATAFRGVLTLHQL